MRRNIWILLVGAMLFGGGCSQETLVESMEGIEEIESEEIREETLSEEITQEKADEKAPAVQYKICNSEIEIAEIYFDDNENMKCSEGNNYREPMLELIEQISQKEKYFGGFYDFPTDITLVSTYGVKYEMSASAPYTSQDQSKSYFYIKSVGAGGRDLTYHVEWEEDVALLYEMMDSAIEYEHTKGDKKSAKGVVLYTRKDRDGMVCGIESPESGYQELLVDDLDGAIVGDTVEYQISGRVKNGKMHSEYVAVLQNLTQNDISKSLPEVVTTMPFESYIMKLNCEEENFSRTQFKLLYDWEDCGRDLPQSSLRKVVSKAEMKRLIRKYDEEFFEDHIVMYCAMRVTDVEVTAAAHVGGVEDVNLVYVKEKTDEEVPEGKLYLLWVEMERENWNNKMIYPYFY